MPAITDVEGLVVRSPAGKELGTVQHVLFHPSEARAVGVVVIPVPLAHVVSRKPRYLTLTPEMLASEKRDAISWTGEKLPAIASSTRDLGFTWDATVIWRNMDVCVEGGGTVGLVADVVFSRKTLKVLRVQLSEGSLSDVAVGRTEVPGEVVRGFDGTCVVVGREFVRLVPNGGLAAASAKGVVHAQRGVEKAADATLAAGVAGLAAVERSFRSGFGRKAMRVVRKAQKRAAKFMPPDEE